MGPTDLLTMVELSEASATTQEGSFLHTINLLNIPISVLDGVAIVQALNARVLKCKQVFKHVITDLQKRAFLHLAAKTVPHLFEIQAIITAQTAAQLGKCQHLEGITCQLMHKETLGQGLLIFTKESFEGHELFTNEEDQNVLTIEGQDKLFGSGHHLKVDTMSNQIEYTPISSADRELQLDMSADAICNIPSKWSVKTQSLAAAIQRLNVAWDKNYDAQKSAIASSLKTNTTLGGELSLKFYLNVFTTVKVECPMRQ